MKDWQNLIAVGGIMSLAFILAFAGKMTGDVWAELASWLGCALILGIPAGIVATGWSVQAQAKAAETVKSLRDKA